MVTGDILLNHASHVAIYVGDGRVVHARSSEGNTQPGDQSGNEIRVQSYWNYPWNVILRYSDADEEYGESQVIAGGATEIYTGTNNPNYPEVLKYGDIGTEVKAMQEKLNAIGYNCGIADGDFGKNALAAVQKFQTQKSLLVDGEAGPDTLGKLNSIYDSIFGDGDLDTPIIEEQSDDEKEENKSSDTPTQNTNKIAIGDVVDFTGRLHYIGANFKTGTECKPGAARVTAIREGAAHPYHLVKFLGSKSTVYGWVDANTVKKE